ncbi:ribosome hibernation factor-recruiting GTPase MRF [Mycolicibacterium brumae]|uniref:CobW C-terminal domain-containing protein n=1 Tax=Mycolicibacterium brumae TaxID=85968 RepID=A0A2G5PH40_9MYCO|nr:GTP-binding protein [Mycolicibacterium brumae]MCV7192342.1 GTP-binding protein [Mycolicibacterium brumae]PIB77628.1 hypothetical protein CQY22_001405 [Mycolicibacterium brumae]RWA18662.1 hypothetical protein MBRU_05470 [Mycolicibacterium brumae DSM 44177]UWW10111.1 GTP-binding protein [Mycolicibacterium brumae]
MRTPVVLVSGQGDSDAVVAELLRRPGTLSVRHHFDGHVVHRATTTVRGGVQTRAHNVLELAHGCANCTIRDDLLVLLRRLHRREDVTRIVIHLQDWLEPEPICWAIRHVRVCGLPGFIDGPAARDVVIDAVVGCLDDDWLPQALGDEELPDGRTIAQVVVGQAEFADVLLTPTLDPDTHAVLRRLAPRSVVMGEPSEIEVSLAQLPRAARRGASDVPTEPLLAGQPPLEPTGAVMLLEFQARRPFHPGRLHAAVDLLLDGVVRTRGRAWLASDNDELMWLETAGGGCRASSGGRWLAAMTDSEAAYVSPERRLLADLIWHPTHGDRHTCLTALVCGADPTEIHDALTGALLTDNEMRAPAQWARYPDPFDDWRDEIVESESEQLVVSSDEGERR